MQICPYIQIFDYYLLEGTYESYLSQIDILKDNYDTVCMPFGEILEEKIWTEKSEIYKNLTAHFLVTENTSFYVAADSTELELILKKEGGSLSLDDIQDQKEVQLKAFIEENQELITFLINSTLSFNIDFGVVHSRFI